MHCIALDQQWCTGQVFKCRSLTDCQAGGRGRTANAAVNFDTSLLTYQLLSFLFTLMIRTSGFPRITHSFPPESKTKVEYSVHQ